MKTLKQYLLIAASIIMFGACSYNPNDYSCFADIKTEGWSDTETFVFSPEIEDSMANGVLNILVRNTNDYPYSNLWIELESQQPTDSGTITNLDTICIELADIYGNWYGTGIGASYQLKNPIKEDFTMRKGSPLRIRHIMRPKLVTGLEQIGIIFEVNEQ